VTRILNTDQGILRNSCSSLPLRQQVNRLPTINPEETFWSGVPRVASAAARLLNPTRCERREPGSQRDDLENIVARNIDIRYLEQRYLALENEILNALRRGPVDDLRVADLRYRKLIIADEIEQHRLTAQRLDLVD